MKKFVSLFLVLSLLEISCATITSPAVEKRFPERKQGALVITKTDGQQIKGELITVKPNSLLLLSITGKGVSVDIADIKVIRVVKKSKLLLGAGIGLVVGGGGGVLTSLIFGWSVYEGGEGLAAVLSGGVGAAVGLLLGGITGALVGRDETIHFEGMSDSEIKEALNKLRKKARIRDYK